MLIVKNKEVNNLIQFGENVEGYNIRVLNEKGISALADILFLIIFICLTFILFKNSKPLFIDESFRSFLQSGILV